MDTKVDTFIRELALSDPLKAELVTSVRAIYHDAQPALEERFIYGGIGFFLAGDLVGGVFAYQQHVTVEFSTQAGLTDPMQVLEGKGKTRRHLKLRQVTDIAEKRVGFFVNQVVGV